MYESNGNQYDVYLYARDRQRDSYQQQKNNVTPQQCMYENNSYQYDVYL
jgi:hypothetical protein